MMADKRNSIKIRRFDVKFMSMAFVYGGKLVHDIGFLTPSLSTFVFNQYWIFNEMFRLFQRVFVNWTEPKQVANENRHKMQSIVVIQKKTLLLKIKIGILIYISQMRLRQMKIDFSFFLSLSLLIFLSIYVEKICRWIKIVSIVHFNEMHWKHSPFNEIWWNN